MARRKAIRKPAADIIPRFPADDLPPELLHMIFLYLEPTDAACLRWAGKVVAEIGLQYIVPTVYLRLYEESYDRLLAISRHPVVSKYVVKLEYETLALRRIDREVFDQELLETRVIPSSQRSGRPDSLASARAWRAYDRDSIRNLPIFTRRQTTWRLDQAWSIYETSRKSQEKVQQADFFRVKLVEAMKSFQNIGVISIPTYGVYERYVAALKDLLPTSNFRYRPHYERVSYVSASDSILSAVESASLQLREFHCQWFDWWTISQIRGRFAAMKRSVFHLKVMDICFTDPQYMESNNINDLFKFFRSNRLNTGRLKEFITSAPNLKVLRLSFDEQDPGYTTFNELFGSFRWSLLEVLSLGNLSMSEDELVGLCYRHARTLKDLSLQDLVMNRPGSWKVAFHRIRQVFDLGQQLDNCRLVGEYVSDTDYYDMEAISAWNSYTVGQILSDYIRTIKFGDISIAEYYEAMG